MAFSLRLPPSLDNQARIRAEQLGVPLNALICIALDHYLRGGSGGQPSLVVDELDMANPGRLSRGGMPLKAKSAEGLAAKLGVKPPRPVLSASVVPSGPLLPPGPGASKAERRAYTDYIRASRKNSGAVTL